MEKKEGGRMASNILGNPYKIENRQVTEKELQSFMKSRDTSVVDRYIVDKRVSPESLKKEYQTEKVKMESHSHIRSHHNIGMKKLEEKAAREGVLYDKKKEKIFKNSINSQLDETSIKVLSQANMENEIEKKQSDVNKHIGQGKMGGFENFSHTPHFSSDKFKSKKGSKK